MLTAEELRQIRRLHIQLDRRVDSPFAGEYASAFRGRGMEFEEVRPYVPGDDVRHIDWNVTARAGAPFVKQFREERELTVVLALDVSASMGFGGGGRDGHTDKRLQVARLAGALAFAAIRNGDRVGLMAFSDRIERFVPPRKSRGHAWGVIREAFAAHPAPPTAATPRRWRRRRPPPRRTDLPALLDALGRMNKRRSVVVLLSDFLVDPADEEPVRHALAVLCRRHRVHAFLVHDPLEAALPRVGLVDLIDLETGGGRLLDSHALAARESITHRLARLRRSGAHARAVSTAEDPFEALLLHFKSVERSR